MKKAKKNQLQESAAWKVGVVAAAAVVILIVAHVLVWLSGVSVILGFIGTMVIIAWGYRNEPVATEVKNQVNLIITATIRPTKTSRHASTRRRPKSTR